MKRLIFILILTFSFSQILSAQEKGVGQLIEGIDWLGHASVKISKAGKVIYIDPWEVSDTQKADIILITHPHYDHLSPTDVKKLQKPDTVVVVSKDGANKLSGDVRPVSPGDKLSIGGVNIEVVRAYNTNKQFHPKSNNWNGYIIEIGGERIYHAGDTDLLPEMENVKADVALLPIGGTYTMDAEEAAEAANIINPKVAIPIHYGKIVGSKSDAQTFKAKCSVPVEILKQK